jgi:hypothetical protein
MFNPRPGPRQRSGPSPRLRPDVAAWLDTFGRFELDPVSSGIDPMSVGAYFGELSTYAAADPDAFLAELEAAVAGDDGGFAVFGAASLVWRTVHDAPDRPAARPLLEAGLDFKLARGLRSEYFSADERILLGRRDQTHRSQL